MGYELDFTDFTLTDRNGNIYFTLSDRYKSNKLPQVEKVIFNPPATIVIWKDGTKTVVKSSGEEFDEEKGLAMAFMKKNSKDWNKYGKIIKNAERPYQTKK